MARLSLRIDVSPDRRIGPGKIRLLEQIRSTGSIAAAGRSMDMSYRRAWLLVDQVNRMFREPAVTTKLGGREGGGAALTDFGESLVSRYRAMESAAESALRVDLTALEAALTAPDPTVT